MSEKSLLDQWRDMAYDRNLSKNELETFWSRYFTIAKDQLEKFWGTYFTIEREIYEQLLENPDEEVKGTVKELAEKYGQDVMTMVGFLDGIDESLVVPNPIDTMDEDTKMDIYNEGDIAFCGAVITYYDENSGTYSEIDVNEDGTYIAPRGQISTSDLSLSFTYSRSPAAKNTKLSYIKVTYNYNWLNLPFFRWQDPTSVSWDDSKFQMTDNSFSKVDKYDGYVIGPNGELLGPYTNQTHSSENGYANASNAGVSWYADLKGYIGVQPTKLYGSGTFKLAPKSTTTSGSTTLYGHYVHPKAELGLSVNVSSYGSFSISGGSNYDERGSQKTISW